MNQESPPFSHPLLSHTWNFQSAKRLSISQPYQILVCKSFWIVKGIKLFSRKIGTYVIYLNVFSRCNVKIIYQCNGRFLFYFFVFRRPLYYFQYFLDRRPSPSLFEIQNSNFCPIHLLVQNSLDHVKIIMNDVKYFWPYSNIFEHGQA